MSRSTSSGLEGLRNKGRGKGFYMISVVVEIYGFYFQTLRLYEREGFLSLFCIDGNIWFYFEDDLMKFEIILNLMRDLGVNLVGVEIILNMC